MKSRLEPIFHTRKKFFSHLKPFYLFQSPSCGQSRSFFSKIEHDLIVQTINTLFTIVRSYRLGAALNTNFCTLSFIRFRIFHAAPLGVRRGVRIGKNKKQSSAPLLWNTRRDAVDFGTFFLSSPLKMEPCRKNLNHSDILVLPFFTAKNNRRFSKSSFLCVFVVLWIVLSKLYGELVSCVKLKRFGNV